MNSPEEIETLITSFLADDLMVDSIDDISLESNLFSEGHLDSIGIMRLISHIEESLSIKIPPKDLVPKNFMTISAMISYLSQNNSSE